MLQIEEKDMDKLPPARNRRQCMRYKKRTRKYDGWITALEIRVRWNVNWVMFFYSFSANDTLSPVQGWEEDMIFALRTLPCNQMDQWNYKGKSIREKLNLEVLNSFDFFIFPEQGSDALGHNFLKRGLKEHRW